MNFHRKTSLLIFSFTAFGLALFGNAHAQYVWLDEKGVKQFSDQPPPPNVPKNRILKAPNSKPAASPVADGADTTPAETPPLSSNTSAASASSGPPTLAERNAEFAKRKKDQADKEKKAAEESAIQEIKKKNCIAARENQRALESGVRITQVGKNGEREFMNDEQRAKAAQENKRGLEECK
jgi:hypothetical protein